MSCTKKSEIKIRTFQFKQFFQPNICSNSILKKKNIVMRSIYNQSDSSYFTAENFSYMKQLLMDTMEKSNSVKFKLSDLPVGHQLRVIVESIRITLYNNWECRRIPVGAAFISDQKSIEIFKKLRKHDIHDMLRRDIHGNNVNIWDFSLYRCVIDQYFSEMFNVRTMTKTVIDSLRDSDKFLKIFVDKILLDGMKNTNKDGSNFFYAFNKCFRTANWTQRVSNFQPLIMKFIIFEAFNYVMKTKGSLPNDTFVIIDSSSGFGGRLVGTLASFHELRRIYHKKCRRELTVAYLTTDPNSAVHDRFRNIVDDWFEQIETKNTRKYFYFNKDKFGSETPDFFYSCINHFKILGINGANLGMTSPPYFNQEKYSEDEAESHVKYPKYQLWKDGFLKGMLSNVNNLLLPDAYFYLNIANIVQHGKIIHLTDDAIELSQCNGFTLEQTYKMVMTKISKINTSHDNSVSILNKKEVRTYKYEPIFKLKKEVI